MKSANKEYKQLITMIIDKYNCSYTDALLKHLPQIQNDLELYNEWLQYSKYL